MAYNQTGQGYSGHYPHHQTSPDPQTPYQPPRDHTGFDATVQNHPAVNQGNYVLQDPTYRPGSHVRMPNQEHYMSGSNIPGTYPGSHSPGGGYQTQGSSNPSSQSPHAAYNPQQYARAESHYSFALNRNSSVASPTGTNFQPYIPAAYQVPAAQQQSRHGYPGYDNNSGAYQRVPQYQSSPQYQNPTQYHSYPQDPPPVPPRSHDQYGQRSPQITSFPYHSYPSEFPPQQQPPFSPGGPSSVYPAAYTPPAPPPPPISPNPETAARTDAPVRSNTHSHTSHLPTAPTRTASGHISLQNHHLPSLPNYNGSGDYSTPPGNQRQSESPSQFSNSSSPIPPSSQHSPQRMNTTGRHPQSRPLPGPPTPSFEKSDYIGQQNGSTDSTGFDAMMKEVEAAVMGRAPSSAPARQSPRMERLQHQERINEDEEPEPLFSGSLYPNRVSDALNTDTNGISAIGPGIDVNYSAYSDDSDAEAAAGLAAMQMAEEQEAAEMARRTTSNNVHSRNALQQTSLAPHPEGPGSSDSDVPVDMDTYGGTFPSRAAYQYGSQNHQPHLIAHGDAQGQPSSPNSLQRPEVSPEKLTMPSGDYFLAGEDHIHPFPSFGARTDTGGTGGLAEPGSNPRRLSFEDGDEAALVDSNDNQDSSSVLGTVMNSVRSSHARSGSRPLPQIPGTNGSDYYRLRRQTDQYGRQIYPQAPEEYDQAFSPGGTAVQKANSTGSHATAPLIAAPGRSITNAEQRRRNQLLGVQTSGAYESALSPDTAAAGSATIGDIVLPTIPAGKRRKFIASKLSSHDFKRCLEPWAQSSVLAWIMSMTEGETDLKENAIIDGIVALFTHKVPTMNTADAEALSTRFVEQMFSEQALFRDEEWVKFSSIPMSGVIFQLTGTGCYSPRIHSSTVPGRCYSHHCMRTLKKINLQTHVLAPQRKAEDWATFYKIKKADVENLPKKDIERQNNLHEIVTSEDYYMDQLNVLRILYRDGLKNAPEPIMAPQNLQSFLHEVFGRVDAVKQANEDYLLAQLKYRQEEQGPWIKGFSDIFREWIRKAKNPYIEYAARFPNASFRMRKEGERNVLFRQFLDQMRENERSRRLGWDTYLKAPITRLQRYGLLLQTVHRNMVGESEEKNNLSIAIEEIKAVTLECDSRVAEMAKRTDLTDLQQKLKLRQGMEKVQLNLSHLGRELIFRGDLQRKGANKVSWVDTHAILFDHYMVLAKPIQQRDAAGGLKHEVYDVSKLPIPMDLLILESTNDDAVVKSTVKGITSTRAQTPQDRTGRNLSASGSTAGPGTLVHTQTSSSSVSIGSGKTLVASTSLDLSNDKVLYPFRVRHLGKPDVYVLYAPTAQNRADWCDKIIDAKTRHAASLFVQNAEPFKIRVMADTAFAYDSQYGGPRGIVIKGTPLDRAVEECERSFYGTGPKPGPVCRAQVNCATSFFQPYGKKMVAVGTDYGVYISEYDNARGWSRAIAATNVTQVAVLEDFSIFLIISDKSLIAYQLDSVCNAGGINTSESSRRAPQRLSGNRDVGFFATGRMKDRALVFYKKRDGISSTFKVLEPVYQKSAASARSRFGIRKGTTDFFRDFDDFYIPSETFAINLFQTSLAVSTARGIEVLTLDKKVPFSIPDLKPPEVASIAARIQGLKPLGMFRLSDNEFLLVFEEVGIYVDKHGDVSRAVVMEFVGRAKQACLHGGTYLVLVDVGAGFVEVRNAVNGRLRQVVSGRDVKLLDDGANGGSVKICMQHPEMERSQIVVELIVNEGLKE